MDWNKGSHDIPTMAETQDDPWATSWTVWDVHNLRDIEFDPSKHVAKWTMEAGHEFHDFDISRNENVVAVVWSKNVHRRGVQYLQIHIRCYLLEPTTDQKWKDGETCSAIPHPEAVPIQFDVPMSRANSTMLHMPYMDLPVSVKLGPDGTVLVEPWGLPERLLYNWRTGKQVLVSPGERDVLRPGL